MNFIKKPILGMIHLSGDNPAKRAMEEIEIFEQEGVSGIIVENYHGSVDNMKEVLSLIKDTKLIIGLNILPNEYEEAFNMANDYGASFIQLDYVAGLYNSGKFISSEKYLNIKNKFPKISVLGGCWPKYYKPVKDSNLADDLEDAMKRAECIVVTGEGTGKETPLDKIKTFRAIIGDHKLIIGAGLTPSNVVEQLTIADGAIVGSTFKPYGRTHEKVDRSLVQEFMNEVKKL